MYSNYSIPEIARFASRYLYESRIFPFHIDIDIAKPEQQDKMQSWTLRDCLTQHRYQISGPLLLNWHGILFEKKTRE